MVIDNCPEANSSKTSRTALPAISTKAKSPMPVRVAMPTERKM
jgi:hypothetical protein